MKKIVVLILVLSLFSCGEKEVKLPQAEVSVLNDIVDHSPIYMFFEIKNTKDTIIEVNRRNSISSTNWVYSIDKRLPLKLVIPEIITLQEKKANSAHAKVDAINVFSYSDSIKKQLAFFPFTDVVFKYDKDFSKFFIKKNAQIYLPYHNFTVNFNKNNEITIDGLAVDRNEFVPFFKQFSDFTIDGKKIMIHLNFDKNLSYDNYIKNKILAWLATNEKVQLSSYEFIYDEKKLPECGCKL